MISSFYTASTGTIQLQKGVDVVANNIANIATTGYKASDATFADLLYTNINASADADNELKSGHGTKLQKTDVKFTQGDFQNTGRPFDYALTQPDQFFAVDTNGQIKYTRNGQFHLSVQPDGNFLVASDGSYVLDANNQRISVADEQADPKVGVFSFDNTEGLMRDGNTNFTANALSGDAASVNEPELKKGYLEDSSINTADEMVSVMELQKAFQFNSKIVQLSDEIMQTVNGLR